VTYDGMRSVGGVGLQAGLLSAIPGALYGGVREARKPMEDGESTLGAVGRIGKGALVGGAVTGAIGGAVGAGMQHKYRGAYDGVRDQANTALQAAQAEAKVPPSRWRVQDFLDEMMGTKASGPIRGQNPLGAMGRIGEGAPQTYGQMQETMENNPSVFGYLRASMRKGSDPQAPSMLQRTMPGQPRDIGIRTDAGEELRHMSPGDAAEARGWEEKLRGMTDDILNRGRKTASLQAIHDTLARFGLTKTASFANAAASTLLSHPFMSQLAGTVAGYPLTKAIGRNVERTAKDNPETQHDAKYRRQGFLMRGLMPMGSTLSGLGTAGALAASSHFSSNPAARAALIGLTTGVGLGSGAQLYKSRERALDPKWDARKGVLKGEAPEGSAYDSLLPMAGAAAGAGLGLAAHYAPAVSVAARGFANDAWGALKTKLRDMKSAIPSDRLHKMDFGSGVFHEAPRALLGTGR
jgi:uncharacterized protein YfiM (DUF2279 family)